MFLIETIKHLGKWLRIMACAKSCENEGKRVNVLSYFNEMNRKLMVQYTEALLMF